MQLQHLQTNYATAEEKNRQAAADAQFQKQKLQQKYTPLHNQYTAAVEQTRQTTEITQAQLEDYQQKHKHLQAQYATAVQRHQQIIAEEQHIFRTQIEIMQTNLRDRNDVVAMAGQQPLSISERCLRNAARCRCEIPSVPARSRSLQETDPPISHTDTGDSK